MFCTQCGKNMKDSAKFCAACGCATEKTGTITVQLINRVKENDQEAITEVYQKTYRLAYFLAKQILKDEDEAMDVLQDSYIKAFAKLETLESPEKFQSWLNRIVSNQAKDYLKKKRAIVFTDLAADDDSEIEFKDDRESVLPEQVMDREETKRLLMEIMNRLSEEQRLVTMMFYYEELSVKEIAADLGCSENTVKSRLNYARQKIKEGVLDLEKKGTKLYGVAPVVFFVWLLRGSSVEAAVSGAQVDQMQQIIQQAVGKDMQNGAKAISSAAAKGVSHKIIIGIIAGAVAIGSVGGLYAIKHNQPKVEQAQQVEPKEKPKEKPKVEQSSEDLYQAYIEDVLIQEKEIASVDVLSDAAKGYPLIYDTENPLGRYHSSDLDPSQAQWGFKPGMISVAFADMDGDGTEEMIVLENTASDDTMQVTHEIYYVDEGVVKQAQYEEVETEEGKLILTGQMFYELVKDGERIVLRGAANNIGSYPVQPYPNMTCSYSTGICKTEVTMEENPQTQLEYELEHTENRQTIFYAEIMQAPLGYALYVKDYTIFQETYNPNYVAEGGDIRQDMANSENEALLTSYQEILENPESVDASLTDSEVFALIDLNQDGKWELVTWQSVLADGGKIYFQNPQGQLMWGDSIPMHELYWNPSQKRFFGTCERMDGVTVQEFECDPLGPIQTYEFYNPQMGGNPYEYQTKEHKQMIESFYDGHVYRVEYVSNTAENRDKYLQGSGMQTPVHKTDTYKVGVE